MPLDEAVKPTPLKLDLSQVDATHTGLRYLRAAETAWQSPPATDSQTVRVWLSAEPMPTALQQWIREGGTALVGATTPASQSFTPGTWRDEQGNALIETARWEHGRILRFTHPLSPAQMPQLLQADFPQRLREALQGPLPVPARVMAQDYAPLAGAIPYPQSPQNLQHWLALLIATLFLVERWLATSKRRGAAP
jgi:hypothetical protein